MRLISLLTILPLLAACNATKDEERTVSKTVVITDDSKAIAAVGGDTGFKIDTDQFKASVDIPGMEMGGKDFDIDGMKLLPGSTVRGIKVVASEKAGDKHGVLTFSFISPATPDAVLAHAEAQAKAKGWTVARSSNGIGGTKDDKTIAYRVAATGAQTNGTVTLTDDNG